ncbi:MAG: trimethylamine methyltransferase family protein, partial [Chloroflexota bacterium]
MKHLSLFDRVGRRKVTVSIPTGVKAPAKGLIGGQYRPLTDAQLERIHEASLHVLERTGVRVEQAEALELFEKAGADVQENRVRLPQDLVEDAIDRASSKVVLAGRDVEHDLILEDAQVHIGTGGAALQVLDLETGAVRKA